MGIYYKIKFIKLENDFLLAFYGTKEMESDGYCMKKFGKLIFLKINKILNCLKFFFSQKWFFLPAFYGTKEMEAEGFF